MTHRLPDLLAVQAKPKVLLDTNAIRYLFGRDGFAPAEFELIRARLARLAAADMVRVVVTTPLMWELSKFYFLEDFGPARYREMLRYYVTVGCQWAMKNEHARCRLEITSRRRLRDSEVFDACDVQSTLTMHEDEAEVRRIYEMQRGLKDDERAKEAAVRQATAEELEKNDPAWRSNLDRAFSEAEWVRTVKQYVRMASRDFARKNGLRVVGAQWPKPRDMPTFWYSQSFYAAKARRVFVDSKKELTSKKAVRDMPDMLDVTHFRDAAYVDILVSQDEVFREVAAATRLPLEVVSFDDLARSLLSA